MNVEDIILSRLYEGKSCQFSDDKIRITTLFISNSGRVGNPD